MVYWNTSDISQALIGGLAIGIATTIHLLIKGRITGFSGIVYSLVSLEKKSFFWRLALMCSVLNVASYFYQRNGTVTPIIYSDASPAFDSPEILLQGLSRLGFIFAGFCVGFGTKLGNGCTSGHGVCGLPRLSIRSMVAVFCFMGCGIITATVKHYFNFDSTQVYSHNVYYQLLSENMFFISFALILICIILQLVFFPGEINDVIIGGRKMIVGIIFGFGLVTSGMVKRSKIIGFLTLSENWDPSLMFVMVSAVGFNLITFNFIIKVLKRPLLGSKLEIPTSTTIDLNLVLGACIFGIGWGIGGLCPGPGFALLTQFNFETSIGFLFSLAAGQKLAAKLVQLQTSKIKQGL